MTAMTPEPTPAPAPTPAPVKITITPQQVTWTVTPPNPAFNPNDK